MWVKEASPKRLQSIQFLHDILKKTKIQGWWIDPWLQAVMDEGGVNSKRATQEFIGMLALLS